MGCQIDVKRVARDSVSDDVRVFTSLDELGDLGKSLPIGMLKAFVNDIKDGPEILAERALFHVRKGISNIIDFWPRENPPKNKPAILMIPGYFGPNHYLDHLAQAFEWPKIWHRDFEGLRLTGDILVSAKKYFDLIKDRIAPTIVVAHSRGGPTALNMLKMLQDAGLDDMITAVVLISPISSGIRGEVGKIAKYVPHPTIKEMCEGSEALKAWEGLSAKNRAKVVVINGPNGDQFTSLENSHVEGGTLIVTPEDDGHLQQCVDPDCGAFKAGVAVVGGVIDEVDAVETENELQKNG